MDSVAALPISNVFVYDLTAQTTTLASATTDGQLSNANAYWMQFSPDSGSLFFASNAIDLTSNPPDTSGTGPFGEGFNANNLFVHDLSTGTTSLITATTGGQLSDSTQSEPVALCPTAKRSISTATPIT